jgi:hypothetical protein
MIQLPYSLSKVVVGGAIYRLGYNHRMKTKQLTFLLALTFLFLFSGSSTSSSLVSLVSTEKADPPIPVIGSHFYVGTRDLVNDKFIWRESDFVPLIPKNTCYEWDIQLDTEMESVQVKEVFILPSKPKTWGDEEGMNLQHDNKVSVRQKVIKLENGTISSGWCVAEGDPTGNHKIDVFVNGVLAKSFSFVAGLKL